MLFEVEGEESKRLLVKQSGNGGYTYLPKSWVGREIEVILLPEENEIEVILQRDNFNVLIRADVDNEYVEYWNDFQWVEHTQQIMQNESFQDEETQEEWDSFIDDIDNLNDEDMFFQWCYDLGKGSSHTFENGITLFKQF